MTGVQTCALPIYALRTHCDDAGDCADGGNFRGVCPVIGRLRHFVCVAYIAAHEARPANVGLFFMAAE